MNVNLKFYIMMGTVALLFIFNKNIPITARYPSTIKYPVAYSS